MKKSKRLQRTLDHFQVYIEKNRQDLTLFVQIVNKLNKLGYDVRTDGMDEGDNRNYFFFQIDKDKKECFAYGSITGPACLGSCGLRPIPIKGLFDDFKKIMSKSITAKQLENLEKLSYIKH